ncbi:hypothetical protein [Aeromonas caviae]|uniref:hypothetical protein n=1 Tax=Aeromonas caviae TaxID=648 RepID=UPI001118985E|nr:hypothetical protein [Aeromonas caviae]
MKRCSSFEKVIELSFYFIIAFCAIWKIIPTINERGFWSDELFTAAVVRYHPILDSQFERKTVMQIKMNDSFLTVKAGEQHPPMYDLSLRKVRTSIPRTKNENFSHLISMGYQ